jgi:anti-sigma regulatory factor (Ser/Thr protein kinase)
MAVDRTPGSPGTFQHEALLYDTERACVAGTVDFITEGLRGGEPVLVMIAPERIAAVQSAIGRDAGSVRFADMRTVGRNPARIIPVWQQFAAIHPNTPLRGVGEPVWAERQPAELVEAQCHELLLNLAFAGTAGLHLLCPYDRARLDGDTITHAHASHPTVRDQQGSRASNDYCDDIAAAVLHAPLLPAPDEARTLVFDAARLRDVRGLAQTAAQHHGLEAGSADDFVLAVDEVATNSVRYGGGTGLLRCWESEGVLMCEVRDRGRIKDPLVGRIRPVPDDVSGRGLWIANQVCDLVQVRSDPSGSVVRLHMR